MLPFKQGVIERLNEVYTFAKREHEFLGPDGYKIAITALLGFTPTNWETNEVFKNQNNLNLEQFKEIVKYKLEYIYIEQYICDIFASFDTNFKGYITIDDIHDAWDKAKCDFPWSKIEEAFRTISHNSVLDYSEFHNIISDEKKFI